MPHDPAGDPPLPGEVAPGTLPGKLLAAIDRATGAAKFLRGLVTVSALFCLAGSIALAAYWLGGGIGGIMKIGLGGVIAGGFALVFALAITWLVLGRVASIEDDLDGFSPEFSALLQAELAKAPDLRERERTLLNQFRALGWLYRLYPRLRSLGAAGKELASAIGKAAILGNPLVNLAVLGMIVLGFLLPLCGGLFVIARLLWRSRVG